MASLNIDALRREQTLQAHHWHAAKWFADQVVTSSPVVVQIQHRCRELEFASTCYGIDSFSLLNRAAVSREALFLDDRIIGVLRETLNMVDRTRKQMGQFH